MKVYARYFILFLFINYSLFAKLPLNINYDRASYAAQQGNWEQAQELLSSLLADFPEHADLLYDLGVASYQNNDFQKAHAYFCNATTCNDASESLREQAFFNAGNASVAQHQLQEAIEHYEEALAINSYNEFARHNLEKIKDMLKQEQEEQEKQKNEQEQQEKSKKENEQNENEQNDKNNSEQGKKEKREEQEKKQQQGDEQQEQNKQTGNEQSNDNQSDEDNSNNEQLRDDDQKQDSSKEKNQKNKQQEESSKSDNQNQSQNSNEKEHEDQQAESGADCNEREQERNKKNRNEQSKGANEENQRDRNDESDDPSKEQEQHKQQNNTGDHNPTPTQQDKLTSSSDNYPQNKQQEQKRDFDTSDQTIKNNMSQEDQWINAILERQAEKGKEMVKKIIGAKIQKECGGKAGQNCW